MKTLAIDLRELATALEDHSGLEWYLDIETGDVLPVPDDADELELVFAGWITCAGGRIWARSATSAGSASA